MNFVLRPPDLLIEAAGIRWLEQEILSQPLIGKPPDAWVRVKPCNIQVQGAHHAPV